MLNKTTRPLMAFPDHLDISQCDPELWSAVQHEAKRQEEHIELIASENYTSPAVMRVQGSILTNKYAEGYPGKRYYGGCEFVDIAETLAIERAKKLFNMSNLLEMTTSKTPEQLQQMALWSSMDGGPGDGPSRPPIR